MKLSISNIAWTAQEDSAVYALMKKYGYTGLEIAPTRIFEEAPYEKSAEDIRNWQSELARQYGFIVPSMQSIWFGRSEKLFADASQRSFLFDYTKKAIDFADAAGCKNLVFGSPKNRAMPVNADKKVGVAFFKELGAYAAAHHTAVGMEPNPAIYNTNYINTTAEAIELIKEVESEGFLLNLDSGTMIENRERVELLEGNAQFINHVHVSEPFLKPIHMDADRRNFHAELAAFLKENKYQGFVSIEMGKADVLEDTLAYVKEIFG